MASGQAEILRQKSAYDEDLEALENLEKAMRNINGELLDLSERQKIFDSTTKNATDRVKSYGQQMVNTTKTLSDFKEENAVDTTPLDKKVSFADDLKSFGASALSTVGNIALEALGGMALQAAASLLFKVYDMIANRTENIIADGKEARETIQTTFDEYADGKKTINALGKSFADSEKEIKNTDSAIDSIADKYAELSKGVNEFTNENQSLSTEEYDAYLEICNQLATQFPSLVSGYDAQGNAILNLGNNATIAANKIRDLFDAQQSVANLEIGDNLQTAYEGIVTQVKEYQKQIESYEASISSSNIAKSFDFSTTLDQLEDQYIEISEKDFGNKAGEYYNQLINILNEVGVNYTPYSFTDDYDKETNSWIQNLGISMIDGTDEQLSLLREKMESFILSAPDLYGLDYTKALQGKSSIELLIADQWKSLSTSLGQYLQTTDSFNNLNEDLQNAFIGNLSELDISALTETYDGEVLPFLYQEFLEPLSQLEEPTQDILSNLFALDTSEMTLSDYSETINKAFEEAFPNDKDAQTKWRNIFGIDKVLDESTKTLDRLKILFKDNIADLETMTQSELTDLFDFVTDNDFKGSLSDALSKMSEMQSNADLAITSMANRVTAIQSAMTSFNTALSETNSATGLSSDTIALLTASFDELGMAYTDAGKELDLSALFENTAAGVKLNQDVLRSYSLEQENLVKNKFAEAIEMQNKKIAEQQKVVKEAKQALRDNETDANQAALSSAQSTLDAARETLAQYKQQQSIYLGLISDRNKWFTETTEAVDNYNTVSTKFTSLQKLRKDDQGLSWTGSNEFRNGLDYFWSGDADTASIDELEKTYDRLIPLVKDWYQTNEDGTANNKESINAFIADANNIESIIGGSITKIDADNKTATLNATEFAKAWGVSYEVIEDVAGMLHDLGYEVDIISKDMYSVASGEGSIESPLDVLFLDSDQQKDYEESFPKIQEKIENADEATKDYLDTIRKYGSEIDNIQYNDGKYDENENAPIELEKAVDSLRESLGLTADQTDILIAALKALGIVKVEPEVNTEETEQKLLSLEERAQNLQKYGYLNPSVDLNTPLESKTDEQLRAEIGLLEGNVAEIGMKPHVEQADLEALYEQIESREVQLTIRELISPSDGSTGYTLDQLKEMTEQDLIDLGIEVDFEEFQSQLRTFKLSDELLPQDKATSFGELVAEAMSTSFGNSVTDIAESFGTESAQAFANALQEAQQGYPQETVPLLLRDKQQKSEGNGNNTTNSEPDKPNTQKSTSKTINEYTKNAQERLNEFVSSMAEVAEKTKEKLIEILPEIEQTLKESSLADAPTDGALAMLGLSDTFKGYGIEGSYHVTTVEMPEEEASIEGEVEFDAGQAQEAADSVPAPTFDATVYLKTEEEFQSPETPLLLMGADNSSAKDTIDETKNYADEQTGTMTADANTEPAKDKVNAVKNWISQQSEKIKVNADTSTIGSEIQNAINSHSYTANVSVQFAGGLLSLLGFSQGTMLAPAHASGTAYNVLNTIPMSSFASGKVALPHNETALVNELGQESIIRQGKWFLLPGKMHTENLKKGDIILNAKQTADLRKYGKTDSFARAYASGTLSGNYLATSYAHGSYTFKAQSHASDETQELAKEFKKLVKTISDETEQLVDHIATSIDNLQRYVDKQTMEAEDSTLISHKLYHYNKVDKTLTKMIEQNQKAAGKYLAQANAVGLDSAIAKKVRKGSLDISVYDEDTQKKISEYEEWYQKMLDCQTAINELHVQQRELAKTKIDIMVDKYDLLSEYAGSRRDRNEAELKYRETAGYSNVSSREKLLYQDNIKMEEYTLSKNQNIANQLRNEIQYQLDQGIIEKYDDHWRQYQIELRKLDEAVYESKAAIEEYQQAIREMETTKLQRVLDSILRWSEQLSNKLDLKEARGQNVNESDYMQQITANNDEILQLEKLYNDSKAKQATYEYGSEKWEEEAEKQADYQNQIYENLIDNETLLDSIFEDRWEEFEKFHDGVENSLVEIEHMRGSLDGSIDSFGNLTSDGFANIALTGTAIDLSKQKIADYNEALITLEQQYRNGLISEEEYITKQREYQGVIRDSASAVKNYEQELIDLWTTQAEKRNELIQEEIDLRKKALSEKKEYHDYDKKLKSQTKELNLLQAQIKALEGVGDAASKAKLAKLRAQAEEARESLEETQYQHEYDMKVTGYETLSTDLQEQLDLTLEKLEYNSELQQNVVTGMLSTMKTEYTTAYSEINTLITNTGLNISSVTEGLLSDFKKISDEYKNINSYSPSTAASGVDGSGVDITKGSNGKSTANAENLAGQKEDPSNSLEKEPSNTGSQTGKATKIKLSNTSLSLKKGSSKTLKVTAEPANAQLDLEWSSKKKKVATVSNGTITGVNAGTAKIIVKDKNSGKTATCTVTVTAKKNGKSNADNVPTVNLKTGEITYPDSNNSSSSDIWKGISKEESRKGDKSLDLSNSIVDRMKYNGYASNNAARAQLWKNLKGSGTYTGAGSQNIWMLNKLKKAGYSAGGVVRNFIPLSMVDMLGPAIARNGDSGVAIGINPGEYVLPEDIAKTIKPTLEIMKVFNDAYNSFATTGNSQAPIVIDSLITVNGNVDKNVMDDLKALGQQLASNPSFMNSITKNIDKQMTADAYKAGFVRKIR